MPKPVPPPPPQPSEEETRAGVRLVGLVAAAAVGLFLLFALPYHVRGPMVEYGRDNGGSWARYKLKRMNRKTLREHEGGRIAWLVGSSILRESFDEAMINELLEEQGSAWRVRKFGQTRGASGLAAGVVRRLPVAEGDLVVHNVAMENFRANWIEFTELPGWRLQLWLKPHELWAIEEWSLAERLEELVAVPRHFYTFHEDHMEGLTRWWLWATQWEEKKPKKKRKSFHLTYRTDEVIRNLRTARRKGEDSPYYLSGDRIDLSDTQFNAQGLERMRAFVAEDGAQLALIDVPPRQEYQATFLDEDVRKMWDAWRADQPEIHYFPQQPEDDYYDMKHPNFRGREALSRYFVSWLSHRRVGAPTPLDWSDEG